MIAVVWLAVGVLGLVAILCVLWIMVPSLCGLPWVPTRRARIRRALELANLQPGETVYDLGAGDGRALIIAVRDFGARAVGIEIEPVHCAIAWLSALLGGVADRVSVRWESFYRTDLSGADVVYIYVTPAHAKRLRPCLEQRLRPGARVVSVAADLVSWQPTAFDREALIFCYEMPPQSGDIGTFLGQV